MANQGGVVYDPSEASCGHLSTDLNLGCRERERVVVVDGLLYCYEKEGLTPTFITCLKVQLYFYF